MMGKASWSQVDLIWTLPGVASMGVISGANHGHWYPSIHPSIHPSAYLPVLPSVRPSMTLLYESKSADGNQHLFQTFTKVNILTVEALICGWVASWFNPAWKKMRVWCWHLWLSSKAGQRWDNDCRIVPPTRLCYYFCGFPSKQMSYCVSDWVKLNKTVI